jgi:hypothetical protein
MIRVICDHAKECLRTKKKKHPGERCMGGHGKDRYLRNTRELGSLTTAGQLMGMASQRTPKGTLEACVEPGRAWIRPHLRTKMEFVKKHAGQVTLLRTWRIRRVMAASEMSKFSRENNEKISGFRSRLDKRIVYKCELNGQDRIVAPRARGKPWSCMPAGGKSGGGHWAS